MSWISYTESTIEAMGEDWGSHNSKQRTAVQTGSTTDTEGEQQTEDSHANWEHHRHRGRAANRGQPCMRLQSLMLFVVSVHPLYDGSCGLIYLLCGEVVTRRWAVWGKLLNWPHWGTQKGRDGNLVKVSLTSVYGIWKGNMFKLRVERFCRDD